LGKRYFLGKNAATGALRNALRIISSATDVHVFLLIAIGLMPPFCPAMAASGPSAISAERSDRCGGNGGDRIADARTASAMPTDRDANAS